MAKKKCPRCKLIRMLLLCILLGGAAGFAVLASGGSRDASMLATFVAAIAPMLWQARRNRVHREDQE